MSRPGPSSGEARLPPSLVGEQLGEELGEPPTRRRGGIADEAVLPTRVALPEPRPRARCSGELARCT